MITLQNVKKTYHLGKTKIHAIKGISLTIEDASFIALSGPSGSGKTTLLNMIGTLDKPDSGEILINDNNPGILNEAKLAYFRLEKLGFVFQNFNLISVLNVYENIELPSLFLKKRNKKENKERILELIEAVGLTKFIKHKPDELSGGQRQRVAIARALVNKPQIILADEPTANLDHKTAEEIIHLFRSVRDRYGSTIIFSTHDRSILSEVERNFYLEDGVLHD